MSVEVKKALSELIASAYDITQKGQAHVFVEFAAHVNGILHIEHTHPNHAVRMAKALFVE